MQQHSAQPSRLARTAKVLHNIRVLIAGVLGGPLLLLGGLGILIYSEHTAARDTLALDLGQRQVVDAPADHVDPALEGKLIHVSSVTTINGPVKDEQFGIAANAVRLDRIVEMLQWVERTNIQRHGEPNVYFTEWTSELVDSKKFRQQEGHHNPNFLPFASTIHRNEPLRFGAYQLNKSQTDRILPAEPREITDDEFRDVSEFIKIPEGTIERGVLQLPAAAWSSTVAGERLNPAWQPGAVPEEIGDIRIRFQLVYPGALTVVAKQSGDSFQPFSTSTGDIDLVRVGVHDVDGMFQQARSDKWYLAWVLRLFSLFCVTAGCCGITLAFGAIAWLTGAAEELPVFRFGWLGTIVLVTVVVVIFWREVDFVFTAATVVASVLSIVAIAWTLRPVRTAGEEIVTAELADDGLRSKYPTFQKRE